MSDPTDDPKDGLEDEPKKAIERAPRPPRAPAWWRRALRKVLPGTALPQMLFDELQGVDPKTLRTIMAETAKHKTFEGAAGAALRTALAITPPVEGALPASGSTLPELGAEARVTVPLRDLVAFNETIQALKAENEELRAKQTAKRIAVRFRHHANDDLTNPEVYLAMSDGSIMQVDHDRCRGAADEVERHPEEARKHDAYFAPPYIAPVAEEPDGLLWMDIDGKRSP